MPDIGFIFLITLIVFCILAGAQLVGSGGKHRPR